MTAPASGDTAALVAALRSVLDAGSADLGRPGHLRQRLEAALGAEETGRLRPLVHQVVVAAEENLPAILTRIAPLTGESVHRLSGELAESRGWTLQTARRATQIWAAALGLEETAPSRPQETPSARPQPALLRDRDLPGPTTPPPDGQAGRPARSARLSPGSQRAPLASVPREEAAWPEPRKRVAHHATSQAGEPALGVVLAYAGMPLQLFAALLVGLTAVLVLPVLLMGVMGYLLPAVGAALAAVLVRRLGYGVLVATSTGLEFTPYDGALRKPRPDEAFSVPWREVRVEPAHVSVIELGERRVQVGPRNRGFAAAAARCAGGSAR